MTTLTIVTVVLTLVAALILAMRLFAWGEQWINDWCYGTPRAVRLSGYVGHLEQTNAPTHFIALNLDGYVSVLEIPGGDMNQLRILPGPYVVGADGASVVPLLNLVDVDGDGHNDLTMVLCGETIVYLNRDGVLTLINEEERLLLQRQGVP